MTLADKLCPIMRARMSLPLPGPEGETIRIVLLGYVFGCCLVCANTTSGAVVNSIAKPGRVMRVDIILVNAFIIAPFKIWWMLEILFP
jgi:hypothetical protein